MAASQSSENQPKGLGLSLALAFKDRNLKRVSELLSSARDSEGKLDNTVMVTLLSARGSDFGKDNYVDFLLKELKVSSDDPVGQLETAVLKDDVDEVEALLSSNNDFKEVLISKNDDSRHQSFVLYAVSCRNSDIKLKLLRLLIDNGVVNTKAFDKCVLGNLLHMYLMYFSKSCNEEEILDITTLLVDAGVCLEEPDAHGRTSLHICAERKLAKVVSFLINDKNVNVNVKTRTGWTPLHYAVNDYRGSTEGHLDVVKLLLNKGADINAKNVQGGTPLLIAKTCIKSDKTIEFLLQNGAHDVKYSPMYSPFGDLTSTHEQKEIMIKIKEKFKNGQTLTQSEQEMMETLIASYDMTLETEDNTSS